MKTKTKKEIKLNTAYIRQSSKNTYQGSLPLQDSYITQTNQPSRKRVDKKERPTLKIPKNIIKDIQTICNRIPNKEWSAILFYDILQGSMDNPNELVLEVVYIWVMAVGSEAHVTFEYDEDWIKVFQHYPELESMKMGIIHSHANMSVFHSHIDMKELSDNCGMYDYYLSLVTNNNIEFDCKIAVPFSEIKSGTINRKERVVKKIRNSLGKIIEIDSGENKLKDEFSEEILYMDIYEVKVIPDIPVVQKSVLELRIDNVLNKRTYYNNPYRFGSDYDVDRMSNIVPLEEAKFNDLNDILEYCIKEVFIDLKIIARFDEVNLFHIMDLYSKELCNSAAISVKDMKKAAETFVTKVLVKFRNTEYYNKNIIAQDNYTDVIRFVISFLDEFMIFNEFTESNSFTKELQNNINKYSESLEDKVDG